MPSLLILALLPRLGGCAFDPGRPCAGQIARAQDRQGFFQVIKPQRRRRRREPIDSPRAASGRWRADTAWSCWRPVFRPFVGLVNSRPGAAGGLGDALIGRKAKPALGVLEAPKERLQDGDLGADDAVRPAPLSSATEAMRQMHDPRWHSDPSADSGPCRTAFCVVRAGSPRLNARLVGRRT